MAYYYEPTFDDQLEYFRHIHAEVATMMNGIRRLYGSAWINYSPSDFLYSFVFFNTLYDINWEKSLDKKRIFRYRYEEKLTESQMQENYIHFLFSHTAFVELYKEHFITYILQNGGGDKEKVMGTLRGIHFSNEYKEPFLDKFEGLLSGDFEEHIIKDLTDSIYRVRCNIFHGKKDLKDLGNKQQQKRLIIYTSFLIALNQMLFSYLDYRKHTGDFVTTTKNEFKRLRKK